MLRVRVLRRLLSAADLLVDATRAARGMAMATRDRVEGALGDALLRTPCARDHRDRCMVHELPVNADGFCPVGRPGSVRVVLERAWS